MDTVQILCTLCNVIYFLDIYASDPLPRSITKTCTLIFSADPHTEVGSQWLAIHFRRKSSRAYYFDSYGIVPFVTDILVFIRRNCTTWAHKKRHLQFLTSYVYGTYCCLFRLYMDRGYTLKQFVALFSTDDAAHRQVNRIFTSEFEAEMTRGAWGQLCRSCVQNLGIFSSLFIPNLTWPEY